MSLGKETVTNTIIKEFADGQEFTSKDAQDLISKAHGVLPHTIRGRLSDGIRSGLFQKVARGVYQVTNKGVSALFVNGDGRDLSFIEDGSIDAIITDHPYQNEKALKGGNRNFAEYNVFEYNKDDFAEKFRVLKAGGFLVEFVQEESATNFEYLHSIKMMAKDAGFQYYAKVPWKKGAKVNNTGRKAKNSEELIFFTKGEPPKLRRDAMKNKKMALDNNLNIKGLDAGGIEELLIENGLELSYMKGAKGMLPICFDYQPPSDKERIHQAEKPANLLVAVMEYISNVGDIILDQFAGSMSTAVAGLECGRNTISIELDLDEYNKGTERFRTKQCALEL